MRKLQSIKKYLLVIFSATMFLPVHMALAICPVCTIAVGAGVGLAQYFGVDDAITGVWIGGLIISMAFWTDNWLKSKNKNFSYQKILSVFAYYIIVIWPLYAKGIIGHPFNKICGVDKLLFGIVSGSLGFWLGSELHIYLKKKNSDKVYFPFQKVVMAIAPLVILSAVFYIISKC